MTISAGTTLGHYTIVAPLGSGAMGDVYLAEDTRLDRKVALKLLPRVFAEDAERMSRFVREAKSASALNHPNILTIHEIGDSGGHRYISTELIVGETLRVLIARGALPIRDSVEIAAQIAAALNAAHTARIVHRDIKPDNVMIRADGLVKVLDFGLAKSNVSQGLDPDAATIARAQTQPGLIMGTVAYMSPEQSRGKAVDARTDIWSLGVVIYEMLSGRQPFEGETSTDVLANILHRDPVMLTLQRQDVPADLIAIVERSLAKDLDARYQSTEQLVSDLKTLKRRLEFEAELERTSPRDTGPGRPEILPEAATRTDVRRSIAVLPFKNMSADPENEYFCDGLAEELLNALAKIDGLRVAARTSAFAFKSKQVNISEIGRALSVKTVLEGSVRKSGNRMRISVQLVNASDGFHEWSERYDREMQDIFDVQDEITLAVVDVLKVKLFGHERAAALKRGTDDAEAYQLYLKGRFCWNKRTADSLKQAVEHYEQAIARDPSYALAHAGLAESYVLFSWLSVSSPQDSMPKARAAALRALELDDALSEAHAALGVYLSFYAWDQPASEKALRRAIALNPNSAAAYHWLGNIALLAMGRFDEAIAAGRHAEELDPLSPIIGSDTGFSLLCARRFDDAIAQFQHTLTLDPNFYVARYNLGQAFHATDMYEEAIREYRKCLVSDDDPWVTALLARSLATSGQRDEAIAQRDLLIAESARRYVPNVGFAIVYGALGETDEAFTWLERDLAERSLFPPFYTIEPVLDDLRHDARFDDLVRRVGLARMDLDA